MREPFYSEQDGCHYILEDKGHYHLMRVISAAYGDERELSVDALDGTAAIGSWNLHLETFPPWGRVNQAYHGGSIHCGNYQRDTLSLSALSSDAWTRGSPPERHFGALIRISCGERSMTQSENPVPNYSSQEQERTGIRATDAKVVGRVLSKVFCRGLLQKKSPTWDQSDTQRQSATSKFQ